MMKNKWLTPVLVIVGAGLLIFATLLNQTPIAPQKKIGFQVGGLVLLAFGLYRASKTVSSAQKKKEEGSKEKQEEHEEGR